MTITFSNFFESMYYSNTYVQPVDLSEQGISKDLLTPEESKVAQRFQQLTSASAVQKILSEPLTYEPEKFEANNQALMQHGFKLLSVKTVIDVLGAMKLSPYYSVIEHDELDGWVIKSGAVRVPKEQFIPGLGNDKNEMTFFTEEESILRIEMAKRIAKVAKDANIKVVLPNKKLVAYSNLEGVTEVTRKYCVICEKINILSVEETVQKIISMSANKQREIAEKMSTIIQKAGLADASLHNIRLTPEGELAFIDTEPAGLMVAKRPGLRNKLFGPKGASVEKCARIGLFTLHHHATSEDEKSSYRRPFNHPGLKVFKDQIKSDYERVSTPKFSKWKITLSIASLGLIPLINAIVALVKIAQVNQTCKKLSSETISYQRKMALANLRSKQIQLTKESQAKQAPLLKQFYALVEGVPFTAANQCMV